MNSLSFKNLPVRIGSNLHNLSYLTATNASINTNNSLTEVKSLGFYNSYPIQLPTNSITNTISFQYVIQNNDPIKPILEHIKSGENEDAQDYYLDIGGLTISGAYLDSFSLNVNPGTVATAQVNFISFAPFKGQFGRKIQFDEIYPCFTGTSYSASNYYNTFNEYIIGGTGCLLKNLFYKNEFQSGVSASSSDNILIFDNASLGAGLRNFYLHSSNIWREESLGASSQENAIIQSGSVIILKNLSSLSPKSIQPNIALERSPIRHIVNTLGVWIQIKENPLYTYEDNRISYINQNSANPTILSSGVIDGDFLHGAEGSILIEEEIDNYFGLNYNLRAQYTPILTLGASYPKSIKFNGATEELELTENLYKRITYTGDAKNIEINLTAICCPDIDYLLSIDRSQVISSSATIQNNGVVTTLRKFTKYY